MDKLVTHESAIRIIVFGLVLAIMIALENLLPKKRRSLPRTKRWATNLGLVVIDTIAVRIAVPIAAVSMSVITTEHSWGLLNILALPLFLELLLAVILLDMFIYWQHVASHHFPILWRLHKVHHADRDIDASTGVRFHPLEIVLSMIYKVFIVLLMGPAVAAVVLFEILLNSSSLFNHANVRLPTWLDKVVRLIIVTPDMHRIHHSTVERETNSNYGFNLSCWDHLFGSYIESPSAGHDGMTIGLESYQNHNPANLIWTLTVPFHRSKKP